MTVACKIRRTHNDADWHEWVWLGASELADSVGRPHRHASTRWASVGCNNPVCDASGLVRPEVLLGLVDSDRVEVSYD